MQQKVPYFEKSHCPWMKKLLICKELLLQSSRNREPIEIKELPQKRRGRLLLLGEKLEDEVKSFIKVLVACKKGTIVNTHTVIATGRCCYQP